MPGSQVRDGVGRCGKRGRGAPCVGGNARRAVPALFFPAKSFAKYAKSNPQVGRFQHIRQTSDASGLRYRRPDLTKSLVQEEVRKATTDEELTHIFTLHGVYED